MASPKTNRHRGAKSPSRPARRKQAGKASILDRILATTRKNVARRKRELAEEVLIRRARAMGPTRDIAGRLRRSEPEAQINIMAEIKRASPSQGVIRENFAPVQLARELSEAGAAAISVLTEPDYFHGSLRYLRMIADNVELPLLRKDFIVDSYQVYEARLAGADAILLIAAALDPVEFARLSRLARELRLAVLVEVHSEEELKWALEAAPDLVGVNSRNLSTFETDLPAAAELLKKIPAPIVRVAESGLRNRRDIEILRQAGADAFLVGESLMRSRHPGEKLRQMAEINPAGAHTANQP